MLNKYECEYEYAIVFDGTYEGFLCVVYAYYYEKILPVTIQEEFQQSQQSQQSLIAEEYYIGTDSEKAMKVQSGISKKISQQAENHLIYAFLSVLDRPAAYGNKYMDMFRYIVLGFKVGAAVDDYLQVDYVLGVHKRARYTGREAHLLYGFTRFSETKEGMFYCDISPVNDVLPLLAEHFSDRMMNQAWIIHDKRRNRAAIYDGTRYVICEVPEKVQMDYVDKESQVQALWRIFFDNLSIKERTNKNLQRNMLPLHFRKHMTEFLY